MKGFFYPRSATGQSSLLPPPPWHYSGDLLTIEYRTDPKKVAAVIRAGKWDTVLGPISYDKKGDITRLDYVFYVWKKGILDWSNDRGDL